MKLETSPSSGGHCGDPRHHEVDVTIIGAGPVGLLCAYLAHLCGLRAIIVDKSAGPVRLGRADAINARTSQLLELVDLFADVHPFAKACNTISVWGDGKFQSRQSTWWDGLEGCFHKHFLMLGQPFVEDLLDRKLTELQAPVLRNTSVESVCMAGDECLSRLSSGYVVESRFVIGADGSRSFVRGQFNIPFEIKRPQITWAVIDGVIQSDFPKVPEIIVFQAETSDVAWIPRERDIDRFYVRMDTETFSMEDAIAKINRAMHPHTLVFTRVEWFSQFSVKESVAEKFSIDERIFLVGDACHVHSVNGGMGLNTGMSDAFNLIWKIHQVIRFKAPAALLRTYEQERKPVAVGVVETSGTLVRSTRHSEASTHAADYVKIIEARSGYVTGMGVRYGGQHLDGSRLFDFMINHPHDQAGVAPAPAQARIYTLLDYRCFTILIFSATEVVVDVPDFVRIIQIFPAARKGEYWSGSCPYSDQILLVRPDSYIASSAPANDPSPITCYIESLLRESA